MRRSTVVRALEPDGAPLPAADAHVPLDRRLGLLEVTVAAALAVHGAVVAALASHVVAFYGAAALLAGLAVAGYLGWRSTRAIVTRAAVVLVVGFVLLALHDRASDYILLWYFVAIAVYPAVLPRRAAVALVAAIPVAYLSLTPLGFGNGPIGVEVLRALSLLLVGAFVHATAGALGQVVEERARVAALLDACLDQAPVAFAIVDQTGHLLRWNSRLGQLRAGGPAIGSGLAVDELRLADPLGPAIEEVRASGVARVRVTLETGDRHWLASVFPVRVADRQVAVACMASDVSERHRSEQRLHHLATHDTLTGLPNRALFTTRLSTALATQRPVAVLFCDVDNFKVFNDGMGHVAGDLLLIALGRRLRLLVASHEDVARLGGDEFAVLLHDVTPAGARSVAEAMVAAMREPLPVDGRPATATLSVGVAHTNGRRGGPGGLLRDADLALYQAKANGRDRVAVFDDRARSAVEERMSLGEALRQAVDREQVTVAYQPVIALDGPHAGRVLGFEALARWTLPDRGSVPPLVFVPIAEDLGLIDRLGAQVLRAACRQAQVWREEVDPDLTIAVNVSARQLDHPGLAGQVGAVLALTGLAPGSLELEVTESVLMRDVVRTTAVLATLREVGVRVALDDIGTGYSSLAYLRELPVDTIKIARSFTCRLPDDRAMFGQLIALAAVTGARTVVEGVETDAQRTTAADAGANSFQGYLVARPMTAGDATDWLTERVGA